MLERRIAELLGSPVDLLPESAEKRELQDQINPNRLAWLLDTIRPRLWPISSRTWSASRVTSAGLDREAFGGDTLRRDAVERCLERICEAAFRLGEKAAELAPSQPWGDIRGMGN